MKGNFHVRFLGGNGAERSLTYPGCHRFVSLMQVVVCFIPLLAVGCVPSTTRDATGFSCQITPVKTACQADGNAFQENDYRYLSQCFEKRDIDISKYTQWIKSIPDTEGLVFTDKCAQFIEDVQNYYWGYEDSISEDQLKKKWQTVYDLDFANWGHPFESGNCGWQTVKIISVEYLGDLNYGSWFKIEIVGGCGFNDFSNI
jgi:hypothetical protein